MPKRIEEVGQVCSCSYYTHVVTSRLDLGLLDDDEPFEIDRQTPSDSGDPSKCRPIGCYQAAARLERRYREDR